VQERETTADDRGRITLGSDWSGETVEIVTVERDDGSRTAIVDSSD